MGRRGGVVLTSSLAGFKPGNSRTNSSRDSKEGEF